MYITSHTKTAKIIFRILKDICIIDQVKMTRCSNTPSGTDKTICSKAEEGLGLASNRLLRLVLGTRRTISKWCGQPSVENYIRVQG